MEHVPSPSSVGETSSLSILMFARLELKKKNELRNHITTSRWQFLMISPTPQKNQKTTIRTNQNNSPTSFKILFLGSHHSG